MPEAGDEIGHRLSNDTTLYQVPIFGKIEGINPLTLSHHTDTQLLRPAPSASMGDKDIVC